MTIPDIIKTNTTTNVRQDVIVALHSLLNAAPLRLSWAGTTIPFWDFLAILVYKIVGKTIDGIVKGYLVLY